MARGNAREYLFKDQARLKKYFYVLRPLLAIRYIQRYGTPPPVEFEKLAAAVAPQTLRPDIETLLQLKRSRPEMGLGDPIDSINRFIRMELERHGEAFKGQGRPDLLDNAAIRRELNRIFRRTLDEAAIPFVESGA